MPLKNHFRRLLTAAITLVSAPAFATPYYWDTDGATTSATTQTGTWSAGGLTLSTDSTGASATSAVTTTTDDTLVFSAGTNVTGASTVTVSGTQSIGGLTFEEGAVTLTGGTVALGGAAPTITTNADATINSALTGTAGMTKEGAGKLTLGVAPGYSGTTTINNGTLQFGYTAAFAGAVAINSPGTLILTSSAQQVGSGAWSLSGGGALVIGGTNNTRMIFSSGSGSAYTGDITVKANSILEARSFFSSATGNSVTVESGGELRIQFDATSINALNGAGLVQSVSGATTLTVGKSDGSGSFTGTMRDNGTVLSLTKTGSGTQTLSGTITYTGATNINGGTLQAGAANGFSAGSAITLANTGGVSLDLAGFSQTVGSIAGGGTTGGNITLGAGTLTSGGNNTSTAFDGVISGTGGAMVKTGTGTLTLSGDNTYDGGTTISKGGLQLNSATAAGTGAGAVTLNDAGTGATNTTLVFGNGATDTGFTKNITVAASGAGTSTIKVADIGIGQSGTGVITLNRAATIDGTAITNAYYQSYRALAGTGTLTYNGAAGKRFILLGASSSFTGDIVIQSGIFEPRSNLSAVTGNTITVNAGAELRVNADASIKSLNGAGAVGGAQLGAMRLTVGVGDGSGVFTGVMSTANALTKTGAGTQVLSGASDNTYTGGTIIGGGTLVTNKVKALGGASANAVNVNTAGATLQIGDGTGSSVNTVTLGSGASLLVADGAFIKLGALNALSVDATAGTNGVITLSGGGVYNFNGSGKLDLNGVLDGLFTSGTHSYNLIVGSGAVTNNLQLANITGFDASGITLNSFSNGVLTFTAVPEPSAYGLIGAGALAAIATVRRRRKAAGRVACGVVDL